MLSVDDLKSDNITTSMIEIRESMETLSYNVPGLLFPAISLLMLAYTNRFLGLASVARHLVEMHGDIPNKSVQYQIRNLRQRIQLIRHAQVLGVLSLVMCTVSLFLMFVSKQFLAQLAFGSALLLMLSSLAVSLREIHLSARAIDVALEKISRSDG
jgi:hypothetical protein